jgi:CDP-glucose 4,6-dehydratase
LDNMTLSKDYKGKKVFLTGHTGFKGSWMTLWLRHLKATVTGYALAPPTEPAMFDLCGISQDVDDIRGDIRDKAMLLQSMRKCQPDIVFHMAAQPIVRESYKTPLETLEVNVIGTANVLEAVRELDRPCSVVVVTSDKCYENKEWLWGYRENDPMGGADPYSMSKGAAELVVASWRRSFFSDTKNKVGLASARAGNVIGGGDWANDRILTDIVSAFSRNEPVRLRNPLATRPWQHVLEPLSGYLSLGASLMHPGGTEFEDAFNFGPDHASVCTVEQLVGLCGADWNGLGWLPADEGYSPHEAMNLSLSIEKAKAHLNWRPVWSLQTCISNTIAWYRSWLENPESLRALSQQQINNFERDADVQNLACAAHQANRQM